MSNRHPGPMTTSISCTRRLQFCAGHRVMGHENKCAHLHGHNYVVYLTAEMRQDDQYQNESKQTDGIGRVIDFSQLKATIGRWIEDHWDHGFILHEDDHRARFAVEYSMNEGNPHHKDEPLTQKLYLMPYNPTAENMAHYLLHSVGPSLLEGTDVRLTKVIVHETENCSAEASLLD